MARFHIKISFSIVLLLGFIDCGVIQEFDSTFGSFAKIPMLFKRWYHPKNEKTPLSTTGHHHQLALQDQQIERQIINAMNKFEQNHEFEQLPKPLHQKAELKGYRRDDETFILEDSSNTPCVMAYFKASITVYYPTNIKEEKYENKIVTPPDDVKVSGTCDRDSMIAILDLSWSKGTLSLRFTFDDSIDSWFVDQFKFTFDSSAYKGAERDERVVMISETNKRFWTTNHAKSFRCLLLHDVALVDDQEMYSGTIHFNEARVQALTKTDTFKNPKHCIHRVHRDVMVPIAVGGSLVGLTIITVVGYGAFRYFKVKKFQYGNME